MDAAFACPKCGYVLKAPGLTPGRQTRCDWCDAWVEVPFLPRVAHTPRRWRRSQRPAWLPWAWGAVALLAVVVLTSAINRWVHARSHRIQEQQMAGFLAAADEHEHAGRLSDAVVELESALALRSTTEPATSARVEALARRRDALARREVEAELKALEAAPPDQVIGACLTLLARVEKLPALARFEETVRARLQQASRRSASAELAAARQEIDAGRSADALHRCDRLTRTIERIDGSPGRHAFEEARALVVQIARQSGVVIDWLEGGYTFGTLPAYTHALAPALADVLRRRGYVTCGDGSSWRAAFETAAPFRVAVVVNEQWGEDYLQSRNRISLLNAKTVLRQNGVIVWEQLATARTQVPVPKLPAYHAARLGFGDAPVPEYERVLYDNARPMLLERFGISLGSLPERAKLPVTTPPPHSPSPTPPTAPGAVGNRRYEVFDERAHAG